MYTIYDEDEFETITHHRPCTNCGGNLGRCRGVGCNGSFGIGSRRRAPDEIRAIKERRRLEHEDAILAEAEAIRARRGIQ